MASFFRHWYAACQRIHAHSNAFEIDCVNAIHPSRLWYNYSRSNAAATIYFTARICAVFIWERHLLIPVAAREAILRETVDWYRWSRIFWPLCWCRRRLELVLDCLSCTCHRKNKLRGMSTCWCSRIVGVAQLLLEGGDYFVQHFQRCSDYSRAATNRERCLIKQTRYLKNLIGNFAKLLSVKIRISSKLSI